MAENVTAFPLAWPHWVKRCASRQRAKFATKRDVRSQSSGYSWKESVQLTVADARRRLQGELDRLGARNAVLSTNVELRLDGQPRSDRREPDDPGAAVYFTLKGKQLCMPCDKWDRVADNIAAIAAHIDAVRRIERYGVQSVEEAFAGFVALPPPLSWRQILGVDEKAGIETVEATFRRLAAQHHPDRGGSTVKMAELNAARDAARRELGA